MPSRVGLPSRKLQLPPRACPLVGDSGRVGHCEPDTLSASRSKLADGMLSMTEGLSVCSMISRCCARRLESWPLDIALAQVNCAPKPAKPRRTLCHDASRLACHAPLACQDTSQTCTTPKHAVDSRMPQSCTAVQSYMRNCVCVQVQGRDVRHVDVDAALDKKSTTQRMLPCDSHNSCNHTECVFRSGTASCTGALAPTAAVQDTSRAYNACTCWKSMRQGCTQWHVYEGCAGFQEHLLTARHLRLPEAHRRSANRDV